MSEDFKKRKKFIESCNSLILELQNKDLNENVFTDATNYLAKLYDNTKSTIEIADFYKKLVSNTQALQTYLNNLIQKTKSSIAAINNEYFNKLLKTLNSSPSLKNLIYISTIACMVGYYIKFSVNIPNLVAWGDNILQSQLIDNPNIDNILRFFEMLIKIVGSIFFIYEILIKPYKNEILNMGKKFNLSKNENYNKIKKVLITESQLREMVRKMLMEEGIISRKLF